MLKENEFNGVRRAIFIADAGLEALKDSTMEYAVHPDEAYRYSTEELKSKITLNFGDVLKEVAKRKIEIDTYPIGNFQKIFETCDMIARETTGNVTKFDPEKDDLAAKIETVITEQILMKI